MVFSSIAFLCIFLPAVFLIYVITPSLRAKNYVLVIASLIFYAYGEPLFIFFLLFSVLVHYLAGRIALRLGGFPKALLALVLLFDVLSLAVFKYSAFIAESANSLFGLSLPVPQISLPVGISFFTFQIMSYVIDCRRDSRYIQKNFTKLLLYIMFFPQLIAGPIVKYNEICDFLDRREHSFELTAAGIRRFCCGLAKKVLIANCAAVIADAVFALPDGEITMSLAWIGAISYSMQIYFDFSGYSDMAIGMGHMFGFSFPENFNYPFAAVSVQDFWRRWHISLSTWFKLYVYIPLGGNRKGRARAALNRLFVFFLTGLWHGASLTFIVWGLFHGVMILLEDFGVIPVKKVKSEALKRLYTFAAVSLGFVIFRAEDIGQALVFLKAAFFGYGAQNLSLVSGLFEPYTVLVLILAAAAATAPLYINRLRLDSRPVFRALSYCLTAALLLVCIVELISNAYNPFIYFRF